MNDLLDYVKQKPNDLFVSSEGQYQKVRTKEILWITSDGNMAHLHCLNETYIIRMSLTGLLKLMPTNLFMKIHKSFIVQLDAIERIDRTNNELLIQKNKIPIGRNYKSELLARFKLIG